ncbi:hypothetical protein [Cupriavidus sp. AcVe19-1a]|uniref:hypothetical protein n=1 Tax=Cupriavidus sp. AcVe19-1a TaxID=2821359 RepID=UPI001AE79758|nr:hypothetical protein [Cupriavidus sp. AcVe19-1a]MBP0632386.1 hypothetical protein [Cupriavidus sp. AcVe19-1a]
MDIAMQTEVLLRVAGYETWTWAGTTPAVICFENAALIGFVYVFPSANDLLTRWQEAQNTVLSRHGAALRAAGAKAWNVYSVFLTGEQAPTQQRAVERIEEDFTLTRKIARAGVRTQDDLERTLLPLAAVRAQPLISETDFEDRLRLRLKNVSPDALTAFLGTTPAEEVARILAEKS